MIPKVSAGQKLAGSPLRSANALNQIIEATNRVQSGEFVKPSETDTPAVWNTDLVKVQNLTGSNRIRGEVVQLGAFLLGTNPDGGLYWRNPWFEGNTVAAPLDSRIAILKFAAKTVDGANPAEIRLAQVSGVCTAWVNVSSTAHQFAVAVASSYQLASASSGPVEILTPLSTTGPQEVFVKLAPREPQQIVTPYDSSGSAVNKPIPVNATTGLIPAQIMAYTPQEDYTTTVYSIQSACYIYVMDNPWGAATAGLALPYGQRYLGTYVGDAAADGKPVYAVHNYGPIIKRFELTANLAYGTAPSSNNAVPLNFDGTNWTKDSTNPFKVEDPFFLAGGSSSGYSDFTGKAPISGKTGYQGWCVLAPDSGKYEIVYLEERAQFIDFTLTANASVVSSTNQATATVTKYHHGRDPDPGSAGITVYDPAGLFKRALNGALGRAEWNDKNDRYEMLICDQETLMYKGICGSLAGPVSTISVGSLVRLNSSPYGQATVASTITAHNSFGWTSSGSSNVVIIVWNDADSQWELLQVVC